MKFTSTLAVAVAALVLAPTAGAASQNDCVQMGKEVAQALNAAPAGTNMAEARNDAAQGQLFCATGMYAQGVARYAKALELLGKS